MCEKNLVKVNRNYNLTSSIIKNENEVPPMKTTSGQKSVGNVGILSYHLISIKKNLMKKETKMKIFFWLRENEILNKYDFSEHLTVIKV